MGQVLIRAVGLLRRPGVTALVLAMVAAGCALVRLPLLGVPGFELSLAVTILLGTLGGGVGVAAAFQERRLLQGRDPRPRGALRHDSPFLSVGYAIGAAFLVLTLTALLPFLIATGSALTRSHCDPFAQAVFYPLLTLPTAVLASAVGVFVGFGARKGWTAAALYLFLLLASAAFTLYPVVAGPQVFAFNFFGGYYPGPLYDEALIVRPALLWFRLETLLVAGVFFSLTSISLDLRGGSLGRPHVRVGSAFLLCLWVLGVLGMELRAPELGLRMTDAYVSDRLGGVRDSDHFRLHYPRGKPKLEVDRLSRDLEFRAQQIATFLGAPQRDRVDVYVYRSPEEKQALVGASHTQFAQPWRNALHLNDGAFPHPVAKHELAHVMAAQFGSGPFKVTSRLGLFPMMAVVEGFAVAADNPTGDLTLHEWAAAMRRQKLAPDLRRLFEPTAFYTSSASRAYTSAGSFLRFLAEQYGTAKLESLYGDGDFSRAYGQPLNALVTAWEKFLDALPLDEAAVNRAFARFREGSLFVRDCAREVAELEADAQGYLASDPERAYTLYHRCATLQPEEPGFRFGEARALARLDRTGEAMNVLSELAERVRGKPALEAEVAMAQSDLAWQRGKPQEAATSLARVISLKPGPELERSAAIKLAAVGDARVGPALFDYFQPGAEDLRLLKLELALEREPANLFVNYLLGRRLEQEGMPALAVKRLTAALAGDLPEAIEREALRIRIQALYEAGDCNGVADALGKLPDLGTAFRALTDEWGARCVFEQQSFHAPLVPDEIFR